MEVDFIMIILNCKKYKNKALFQKMAWLKMIPEYILYYHVIGNENMIEEYKFNNETKTLWVKTKDDYVSLPKKVLVAHKAILQTYKFKYLLKTDDDQILVNQNFLQNLTNTLINTKPQIHYGGFIVDVKENYLSKYNEIHEEYQNIYRYIKQNIVVESFIFFQN